MNPTAARKTSTKKHTPPPLPTRHVYDVLVLGSQLSGALAGALLAKRGYRVLHVDPHGLGDCYVDKGYQLPFAPGLVPSLKLMPTAEKALAELGLSISLSRLLEAGGGELQLIFPRHRLDFGASADQRASEVRREFPSDAGRILSAVEAATARAEATDPFFQTSLPLPPGGFFERWAVKKAARACPAINEEADGLEPLASTPFGDALRGLARFLTYLDDGEAGPLARSRPLALTLKGAHRFPGGGHGLYQALRNRLTELGGDAVGGATEPASVEELVFEGARFSGVKLASSHNVYRASHVIAAMDVDALAPLIPPKIKRKGFAGLFESVRTRRFLFSVNLIVRAEGLPLGLKELALLSPGDEDLGPVLLEVLPARKGDKPLDEERVLCAAAFASGADRDAGEARLRELAARLESAVAGIAPFIEPCVIGRSVPMLDAKGTRGSRLAPHPLLEIADRAFLGVTGLPHRTRCKNLFLASREVIPGLGIEGELIAGERAAALVQALLHKHDPLK
ncbi:MAG: desaturase [Myxococcales bacterium]